MTPAAMRRHADVLVGLGRTFRRRHQFQADRLRASERFFRAEAARNTPGSGLGLSLVQAVAHLHGGTLLLQDAEPGLRAILTLGLENRQAGGQTSGQAGLPAANRPPAYMDEGSSADHDPKRLDVVSFPP